jgi:hypothetical protein
MIVGAPFFWKSQRDIVNTDTFPNGLVLGKRRVLGRRCGSES